MIRTANEPLANTTSALSFNILPTVLGMAGGLLGCLQTGFTPVGIAGILVLGIAGFLIGSMLFKKLQTGVEGVSQSWREDEQRKIDDIHAYARELERLFIEVVPILLRQVKTSRTHTEQEITVLTERFAAMASQLEQLISGTSHDEKSRSVDVLFTESRDALKGVLRVLSQIQT
ncbi:MAG: methyl-accepting chemotaxis protein, partial [Methylomonas sp.]